MIYNLQALRAFAALLVVFHHLQSVLSPGQVDRIWFLPGAAGVDVFFVISGFIMVHTMSRHPLRAGDFAINRAIRVIPLYWIATLAIGTVFALLPAHFPGWITPRTLVKSLFFIPYGGPGTLPILFVGWSLDYEMMFYALFTAAIALAGPGLTRVVALVIGVLVVLVLAGLAFHPTRAIPRVLTDPLNLEFAMGMALAELTRRGLALPRRIAPAVLAIGTVALLGDAILFDPHHRALACGAPGLAMVAAAIALERHGVKLTNRAVLLTGAASYALYLTHPFVLLPCERIGRKLARPALIWALAGAAVPAALGLAILTHVGLERPLTDRLRRLIRHRRMEVDAADPSVPAGAA